MRASERSIHINAFAVLFWFFVVPAYAAGSGMPWEAPLQMFVDSVTGPIARGAAVIAIVLVGIGFAFSESGSAAQKLAKVGLGLCLAFWVASGAVEFFGFAGGAVI